MKILTIPSLSALPHPLLCGCMCRLEVCGHQLSCCPGTGQWAVCCLCWSPFAAAVQTCAITLGREPRGGGSALFAVFSLTTLSLSNLWGRVGVNWHRKHCGLAYGCNFFLAALFPQQQFRFLPKTSRNDDRTAFCCCCLGFLVFFFWVVLKATWVQVCLNVRLLCDILDFLLSYSHLPQFGNRLEHLGF